VVFSYVTLPWDRVKHALVDGFNASSPLTLQIEDLSWSWHFPGISATGVKFVGSAPEPDASGKAKPAPEYLVDDLYARVSIFPLLWGTQKVGFSMDGFGGAIDGVAKVSSEAHELDIELDGVDAGKLPYLADLVGVPLAGTVDGKIELKLPQNKFTLAEGSIELHIADFAIGDGKAKIRDTIALPRVNAGKFDLVAEVSEGTVKVTELKTSGPDLEVVSDGRIRLMDRLDASLAELNLRFKFSDAYKNKDDTTRGIFGAPNSNVPGLLDLDPKIHRAHRDDGFYAWHITGPLLRLNFNPAIDGGGETGGTLRTRRPSPLRGFNNRPVAPPGPAAAPPAPPAADEPAQPPASPAAPEE
jgi:type II secretion system protein N